MQTKVTAQAIRSFPAPRGYTGRMYVTAKLESFLGQSPHFSVTADIPHQGGGCMHEECAKAWPAIKPIIDLHLATIDGVPMHASANGFYWLAGAAGGLGEQYHGASGSSAKTPEECLSILAEHLRISPETASGLVSFAQEAYYRAADTHALPGASERAQKERHKAGSAAAKQVVADFCAAQRERWEQEARDGLALIRTLSEQPEPALA